MSGLRKSPSRPQTAEKSQIVEKMNGKSNIQVVDNVDSLADNIRPQMSGSEDLGTTSSRLFPDTYDEKKNSAEVVEEKTGQEEIFPTREDVQEPAAQPAQQDDIFEFDSLKGKKFKAVIGGQEQVVPVEELVKGYQTDQYLSQKANKLYEERKALAEERQQLEQLRSRQTQDPYQEPERYQDEAVVAMERRLARMEQSIGQIAQGTQQAVYESNQKRLSEELKREGFEDFNEYLPKMKDYVSNLKEDRMVMFYDTPEGGKALYHQLKNKELMERMKALEAGNAPQPVRRPPIVRIDAGSSQGSQVDVSSIKLREALKQAVSSQHPDDWNNYLRLKGVL